MVKAIGRILLVGGAAGTIAAAFLPWVTVEGLPLELDLLRTRISPAGKTVTGMETAAWPAVVGVGTLIAILSVLNLGRRLLVLLGLLVVVAGGGLLYYVLNVVDIETAGGGTIAQTLAGATVTSSPGAGPFLLLAGGLSILLGALLSR